MDPVDTVKTFNGKVNPGSRVGVFQNRSGRPLMVTVHLAGLGLLELFDDNRKEGERVLCDLDVRDMAVLIVEVPNACRLLATAKAPGLEVAIHFRP